MKLHALVAATGALSIFSTSLLAQGVPDVKPGPSAPVQVTNGPSNPVPMTGTVSVTGTQTNPLRITGLVSDPNRILPSQLVQVQTYSATACNGGFAGARAIDTRVMPDATTVPFSIPANHVLVVTNAVFTVGSSAANAQTTLRVGTPCGENCFVPRLDVRVRTGDLGDGFEAVTLTNGFVVKPDVPLCVGDVNHASVNAFATLYGYIAKDE